jgi:hypothetical protein
MQTDRTLQQRGPDLRVWALLVGSGGREKAPCETTAFFIKLPRLFPLRTSNSPLGATNDLPKVIQ